MPRYAHYWLSIVLCLCGSTLHAALYDCFLFYNEVELLKCRFHELNDYVDYFVLVESCETFQGNPKPFYFEENRHLFQEYLHKIIYIPLRKKQKKTVDGTPIRNAWGREIYQREQIRRGIARCHPDDIIMISDIDEIPRKTKIREIVSRIQEGEPILLLSMMYFKPYLNRISPGKKWPGTYATTLPFIRRNGLNRMRFDRETLIPGEHWVLDAGWHFSTCGGTDVMIKKCEAYSHEEENRPEFKTKAYFEQLRKVNQWVPIDDRYPEYIIKNQAELLEKGFIDPTPD